MQINAPDFGSNFAFFKTHLTFSHGGRKRKKRKRVTESAVGIDIMGSIALQRTHATCREKKYF